MLCRSEISTNHWTPGWLSFYIVATNAAAQAGISLQPLSLFCHSVSLPPAVLVGYAALTMAQIRYAGRNLGKLLHSRSSRTELISNPPIFDRHQK